MAKKVTLKDYDDTILYPQTSADAVFDGGDSLSGIMNKTEVPLSISHTIPDGTLRWVENSMYNSGTGNISSNDSYDCTTKYPSSYYDYLKPVIEDSFDVTNYLQISFWLGGTYVGYQTKNGYYNPSGTSVVSLTYDTFAINNNPTYLEDGTFVVPSFETIDSLKGDTVTIASAVNKNRQNIELLMGGDTTWFEGKYYKTSTGVLTESASYDCTDIYPSEYYNALLITINNAYNESNWLQISFWNSGVYAGYRTKDGYFLPNGTSVQSLTFDSFAINNNPSVITDEVDRFKFPSASDVTVPRFERDFYALGDSTTAGAGSSVGKSWAHYLNDLASFTGFAKLAANGSFCVYHEGSGRLSTQVDSVPENTDAIVTVMIGTNDFFYDSPLGNAQAALAADYSSLSDTVNFAESFRYCLEKLRRKAPDAIIIAIQPLPSNDANNTYGHKDETNLFAIRQIERDICTVMGIPLVESAKEFGLSRYTANWNHFYNDFCHPNDTGYKRIAHCMLGKFIELAQ